MTKNYKQSKRLLSQDIESVVFVSEKKVQRKTTKSRQPKKTKQEKQEEHQLFKFQKLLMPKNQVDQIRLQHIASKLQGQAYQKNQAYLIRIKSQFDQYRELLWRFTDLPPLQPCAVPAKELIVQEFIKIIRSSLTSKPKFSTQSINEYLTTSIEAKKSVHASSIFYDLLAKTDYGGAKLKLELQKKHQLAQLEQIKAKIQLQREQMEVSNLTTVQKLPSYEYLRQLQEEQVTELTTKLRENNQKLTPVILEFKLKEHENILKNFQTFLFQPGQRPPLESRQPKKPPSFHTVQKNDVSLPVHAQFPSKSYLSMNTSLPMLQQDYSRVSNTPMNPKKTMLVGEGVGQKRSLLQGAGDLNQFNYKKPEKKDGPEASRLIPRMMNSNASTNDRPYQIPSQFDGFQFSQLYKSQLSDLSQSRMFSRNQRQEVHCVFFVNNEQCPFKFPSQIEFNQMKFACISVDPQVFDNYEFVLVSDRLKILILEQREIMSHDVHMKLSKQDERGAISLVLLKMQYLTQQFLLQFGGKRVIILLQYENQFFRHMLHNFVFPELQFICEQFQITLFSHFDQLKELLYEIVVECSPAKAPMTVSCDAARVRQRSQGLQFQELIRIKSDNCTYQTLLSFIQ